MAECFTVEQLEEYKETFSLFDKEGDGSIAVRELGTVLRALGQHPTEADLQDLATSLEQEGHMSIEFPEFLSVLARIVKETDPETELREAFKIFDKEDLGSISKADLRHIMTTYGDTLNDDEIEEMIKEIFNKEGLWSISNADLRHIMTTYGETLNDDEIEIFDKEGQGTISNADLRRIMTTYGETLNDEEIEEMIKEADTDQDGMVDYAEFITMVISD